jgi:hypothetical protein
MLQVNPMSNLTFMILLDRRRETQSPSLWVVPAAPIQRVAPQ